MFTFLYNMHQQQIKYQKRQIQQYMGILLPKVKDEERIINIPNYQSNKYDNNQIKTSYYNIITFLPLSILKQFMRFSNVVFLFNAILQSIPIISSIGPITAIMPLIFVIIISMIRQGYEDYKRFTKDTEINNRKTKILINGQFKTKLWKQLQVGQLIKVQNGQIIPVDMLLLYSSNQDSLCYIQTANLDGQINLKQKFVINSINKTSSSQIQQLKASVLVQKPNEHLYSFQGNIQIQKQQKVYLNYDNIILRQTLLKNTDEIIGLAIYCGHDSKIMKNQGKKIYKMSQMEKKLNNIQLVLVLILFLMCFSSSFGYYYVHQKYGLRSKNSYIPSVQFSQLIQSTIMFFTNFLLLNFLIPITLNILIQGIKTFSTIFISCDRKMYDKVTKQGCGVLNASILQELGLIDCILTDKTGTLTVNQMVFQYVAIQDKIYSKKYIQQNLQMLKYDKSFNQFWICLIICHNVLKDELLNQYQGSSPDEVCFIEYAHTIGYSFSKRIRNCIQLIIFQKKIIYQFIQIIQFNSRKRMSVIIKDINNQNQIILYCKGADNCIFQKIKKYQYFNNFNKSLNLFAKDGLRTLVFSRRILSQQFIRSYLIEKQKIKKLYRQKSINQSQFNKRYNVLIQNVQSHLQILGGTGIQDQLQQYVPQTISRLQKANINMMMITGDKLQTAQNIGYLSKLLKQHYKIYKIHSKSNLFKQTTKIYDEISSYQHNFDYSIIIQGDMIRQLVEETMDFYIEHYKIIMKRARSIIFCRSSPKQKAMIAKFVKQKLNFTVLSIGDGGNDVGMIQQANIGVGILGKEGNSACHVSDFSISKFKYLDRLVLHHGRWYYYRFSYFFVFFALKNMIITGLIFLFQTDSAFSGLINFSLVFYLLYNAFIGVVMLVYYGLYDQDINDDLQIGLQKYLPNLYLQTKNSQLFSYKRYYIWLFIGSFIAISIFYMIKFSLSSLASCNNQGFIPDLQSNKAINELSLYIIILILNYLDISTHTWFFQLFIFAIGSLLPAAAYFIAINYFELLQSYMIYTDNINFKFVLTVLPIIAWVFLLKIGVRCYWMEYFPTTIDVYKNLKNIYKNPFPLFKQYIKRKNNNYLQENLSQIHNQINYKPQYTQQEIIP